MSEREAKKLQQEVHAALCNAACGVQNSLAGALRLWIEA